MFTDEARFGRMNRLRPCWAPIGTRPGVAAQLIREYIYLYGAVSSKDGSCVFLITPTSNTECFQVFLEVLARKFARQDILLVLDGTPNHRCGGGGSRFIHDRGIIRQSFAAVATSRVGHRPPNIKPGSPAPAIGPGTAEGIAPP
jgi:DDE superfamily endonuclease